MAPGHSFVEVVRDAKEEDVYRAGKSGGRGEQHKITLLAVGYSFESVTGE